MPCGVCSRKMLAHEEASRHPRTAVSHARTHVKKQGRRQWRPQSSPPSRCQARTRNRAVTAGAQSHGTTAACGCRRTACAPTSTPTWSSWRKWRASAHSSAGGGLLTRFCKQVRAPIRSGDAPEGWHCRAHHRVQQGRLPQAGSPLRGPKTFADRTP